MNLFLSYRGSKLLNNTVIFTCESVRNQRQDPSLKYYRLCVDDNRKLEEELVFEEDTAT